MSYSKVQKPSDYSELLYSAKFISNEEINTVLHLAVNLPKPVFIEGPVGSGKTFLAKAFAEATKRKLIRLQCYEGLDESKTIYEWEYSKQLLFTQMLKDKIDKLTFKAKNIEEAISILSKEKGFFSEDFLVTRPVLEAIKGGEKTVLLIDEIDKADAEFEAFLLEVLSEFSISIPEIGTIRAVSKPIIFLTSNNSREISDALKRRCLYLYMDIPDREMTRKIILAHIPNIKERLILQVLDSVDNIRKLRLNRQPSVGEIIDWVKSLIILSADDISKDLFIKTMTTLIKEQNDILLVKKSIDSIIKGI
ncbi:MAG: MoxR family ATPase [Deltaproteobacteria bacterium]|nr:MoxR family ATPase [Deltaproteobacteria bacterium]